MAGPRTRHRGAPRAPRVGRRVGVDAHRVLPVRPVAVLDRHRDRPADGLAAPHAREHVGGIRFDGHPASAAVASLTSAQLVVDAADVDRQARRDAFENHDERAAVRLSGSEKTHHEDLDCIRRKCAVGPRRAPFCAEKHRAIAR